jgi:hypothetical protein
MDSLKEKYARVLVANLLFNEGFSPRGTNFLAEHGTAAVSERMRAYPCTTAFGME